MDLQRVFIVCILFQIEVSSMPVEEAGVTTLQDPASLLTESITGLSILETALHGILPNEDIRTAVQQISSLYKIKAEISNMDNGSNEVEAINKLLDITLNQSCSWLASRIKDEKFSCSVEDMVWLDIKFRIAAIASETRLTLTSKTKETYFNTCAWVEENIYCADAPVEALKTFFEEERLFLYCKPKSC